MRRVYLGVWPIGHVVKGSPEQICEGLKAHHVTDEAQLAWVAAALKGKPVPDNLPKEPLSELALQLRLQPLPK